MEVAVTGCQGLLDSHIISIRHGDARRQAPLGKLRQRGLKFPASPMEGVPALAEPLKIEVLQVVAASRLVLQPGATSYNIPLGDGRLLGCQVSKDGVLPKTEIAGPPSAAVAAPATGGQPSGSSRLPDLAAAEYLEAHGLTVFLQAMLRTLVQERPEDPYRFMQQQLGASVAHPFSAPAVPSASEVAAAAAAVVTAVPAVRTSLSKTAMEPAVPAANAEAAGFPYSAPPRRLPPLAQPPKKNQEATAASQPAPNPEGNDSVAGAAPPSALEQAQHCERRRPSVSLHAAEEPPKPASVAAESASIAEAVEGCHASVEEDKKVIREVLYKAAKCGVLDQALSELTKGASLGPVEEPTASENEERQVHFSTGADVERVAVPEGAGFSPTRGRVPTAFPSNEAEEALDQDPAAAAVDLEDVKRRVRIALEEAPSDPSTMARLFEAARSVQESQDGAMEDSMGTTIMNGDGANEHVTSTMMTQATMADVSCDQQQRAGREKVSKTPLAIPPSLSRDPAKTEALKAALRERLEAAHREGKTFDDLLEPMLANSGAAWEQPASGQPSERQTQREAAGAAPS